MRMRIQDFDRPAPSSKDRHADILSAARDLFRLYGYEKTTVGDVARAVGYSPAYIYKFFESKQAIGEAVCQSCLADLEDDLQRVAASSASPGARIITIFQMLASYAEELVRQDCKLKDMVVAAHDGKWRSFEAHDARLRTLIVLTIEAGRRSGEFERITPIEETVKAIFWVMEPLRNPGAWSDSAGSLKEQASALASLVLRSLNSR